MFFGKFIVLASPLSSTSTDFLFFDVEGEGGGEEGGGEEGGGEEGEEGGGEEGGGAVDEVAI